MSETKVKQLASLVGIPAEQLLAQMADAGVAKRYCGRVSSIFFG